MEVVGVVAHVKNYGVDEESRVELYLPYLQNSGERLRAAGRAPERRRRRRGRRRARRHARRRARSIPLYPVRALDELVAERTAQRRLAAQLISVFAGGRAAAGGGRHLRRDVLRGGPAHAGDRHPHGARRRARRASCRWCCATAPSWRWPASAIGLVAAFVPGAADHVAAVPDERRRPADVLARAAAAAGRRAPGLLPAGAARRRASTRCRAALRVAASSRRERAPPVPARALLRPLRVHDAPPARELRLRGALARGALGPGRRPRPRGLGGDAARVHGVAGPARAARADRRALPRAWDPNRS